VLAENVGLKTAYASSGPDIADINIGEESLYNCQCIYITVKLV